MAVDHMRSAQTGARGSRRRKKTRKNQISTCSVLRLVLREQNDAVGMILKSQILTRWSARLGCCGQNRVNSCRTRRDCSKKNLTTGGKIEVFRNPAADELFRTTYNTITSMSSAFRSLRPLLRSKAASHVAVVRRSKHTIVPLPYSIEDGLPPFLSPEALSTVADQWQGGVLERLNVLTHGELYLEFIRSRQHS